MKKLLFNEFILMLCVLLVLPFIYFGAEASPEVNTKEILQIDKRLPNATLKTYDQPDINLSDLNGRVKIISIVPQLNTPVCDEQTHRFSEKSEGLERNVHIITISTNTPKEQYQFSQKSKIKNQLFLSDNPRFEFGKKTGLLIENMRVLRRTILVVDENNTIKYVDFVPGGGLPNIKKALKAAQRVLELN